MIEAIRHGERFENHFNRQYNGRSYGAVSNMPSNRGETQVNLAGVAKRTAKRTKVFLEDKSIYLFGLLEYHVNTWHHTRGSNNKNKTNTFS